MINIIIPAYNNPDLLERALSSLRAQTVRKKFIVTVIDDGSEENLEQVINKHKDDLLLKYRKISHTGSPGIARQKGLDISDCDYIMFLDSDDVLLPKAIELIKKDIYSFAPDILITKVIQDEGISKTNFIDKKNITWLHGKVYKKSFIDKYNINFPCGMNEDSAFNTAAFNLTKNIRYIDEPTYIWIKNKNSITRSNDDFFFTCIPEYINNVNYGLKIVNNAGKITDEFLAKQLCMYYCYYEYLYFYCRKEIEPARNYITNFVKDFNIKEISKKISFKKVLLEELSSNKVKTNKPYYFSFSIENFMALFKISFSITKEDLRDMKLI